MTALDAQTVRDALQSGMTLARTTGYSATSAKYARGALEAHDRLVASVEALTEQVANSTIACNVAVTQAERAEARVVALTARVVEIELQDEKLADIYNANCKVLRGDPEETCPACGGDGGDNHFDRSLCACGSMHTCCNNCGYALDGCPYEIIPSTSATSPAHRRGAPTDESARLLSPEEALRRIAEWADEAENGWFVGGLAREALAASVGDKESRLI